MQIQTEKWFFRLFWLGLLTAVIGLRDWNSRFDRSINGDGKGYYAYLPAIFIYKDPQFGFVAEIEKTYYPLDGSHFKDFLNEQPNGSVVNKTFPGLALLYAPFFFIAWLIAWIGGFACDGYSLPFQMGISLAHVVYLMFALKMLHSFFRALGVGEKSSLMILTLSFFATNIWYYTVYDHSVGHIFSFFLCCLYTQHLTFFFKHNRAYDLSIAIVLLALMIIIRPTNAVMLLFIPMFANLMNGELWPNLKIYLYSLRKHWFIFPVCICMLSFLPMLWYWQTGNFLVYSYGKETFDFAHPHFMQFLFSFEKGWLTWSPYMVIMLLSTIVYSLKKFVFLSLFLLPLLLIIYILSSWWCWTYGDGFGQRPMIEFIPLIAIVFGVAIQTIARKWRKLVLSAGIPFIGLSLFQGFQVHEGIIRGGVTTEKSYWSHFFQWYTDAPKAAIPSNLQLEYIRKTGSSMLMEKKAYSDAVELPVKGISLIKLRAVLSGPHKDTNVRIVLSSKDAGFYKSEFIGMYLYSFERSMSYAFSLENCQSDTLFAYVWNGSTNSKIIIESLSALAYRKKENN